MSEIKLVEIDDSCMESWPCQHDVVYIEQGERYEGTMMGNYIGGILEKLPCDNELRKQHYEHFSQYIGYDECET